MIVTIRRRIESGNKQTFGHWRQYMLYRNAWATLMRIKLPAKEPPTELVSIKIRSYRTRLLDYANLVAGCKPIPDTLKRLGYIKDDSPKWFHCEYEQVQVAKTDERTEIEVPA
jgi:hypothetical protein